MNIEPYHCGDCIFRRDSNDNLCVHGHDQNFGDCPDLWEPEEHYVPPARGKYGWTDEEAAEYGDMMDHQYRDEEKI